MALTNTDTFSSIILGWEAVIKYISGIIWTKTDGTKGGIGFYFENGGMRIDKGDDLDILQQIWATDDKFVDENDVEVIPTLDGCPYGNHPRVLEPNGAYNPLVDGSIDRWLKVHEEQGFITTGKRVITINSDGTAKVDDKVGSVPTVDTPTSDNTDHSLNEWTADQSGTSIAFSLDFDYSDGIMPDDLDDHTDMIAFATWLESIRTAGSAVGTDLGDVSSYNSRTYTFAQEDGGTDIVVHEARVILAQHTDGVMFRIWIYLRRDSGADIDTPAVRTLLTDTDVSIPTTTGIHKPPFGSVGIPASASKIILPNDGEFGIINGSPYARVRVLGELRRKEINSAVGITVAYSDLEDVVGASGVKWIPPVSVADTIHFTSDEGSGGRLRYPTPDELVRDEETHVIHRFHNKHPLLSFELQDWDGNRFANVSPRQYAEFQLTLEKGGNGELIKRHLPRRRLVRVGSDVGDLTDSLSLQDTTNTVRYRLFQAPATPAYIDFDGFTIPDVVTVPLSTQNFNTFTAYNFNDVFRVNWNGDLEIRFSVGLELSGSGGPVPNGSGLVLFRQRGTSVPEIMEATQQSGLSTADGIRTYQIADIFEVEAGDVIILAFSYPDNTGSAEWNDLEVREFVLQAYFNPDIVIPYTA